MIMQKSDTLRTLLALSLPFLLEAKESGFMLQNYALVYCHAGPLACSTGYFYYYYFNYGGRLACSVPLLVGYLWLWWFVHHLCLRLLPLGCAGRSLLHLIKYLPYEYKKLEHTLLEH